MNLNITITHYIKNVKISKEIRFFYFTLCDVRVYNLFENNIKNILLIFSLKLIEIILKFYES